MQGRFETTGEMAHVVQTEELSKPVEASSAPLLKESAVDVAEKLRVSSLPSFETSSSSTSSALTVPTFSLRKNVSEDPRVDAVRPYGAVRPAEIVRPTVMGRKRSDVCCGMTDAIQECLGRYFKDLGGMTPPPNLHDKIMSQLEKPLIEQVLTYVRGNQVRAAEVLGINRNTLRKKIQTLGIQLGGLR